MVSAGIGVGLSHVPIAGITCSPTGICPMGSLQGLGFSGHPQNIQERAGQRGSEALGVSQHPPASPGRQLIAIISAQGRAQLGRSASVRQPVLL